MTEEMFTMKAKDINVSMKTLIDNIRSVFLRASVLQYVSGAEWYWKANRYANVIAKETDTPVFIVAMVIAVLSPRNPWYFDLGKAGNLNSALKLIEGVTKGIDPNNITVMTFDRNKHKALAILEDYADGHIDPDYYQIKYFQKSPKTWNFANNINNPASSDFVTIDGHATNLAIWPDAIDKSVTNAPSLTIKRYGILVRAYRAVAAEFGVTAWQVQAVTWEVYRNV